jgi:hypothetical protein
MQPDVRREPGCDDGDPTPAVRKQAAKFSEPLFLPVEKFFATCGERVEYILDPYLPKDGFLIVGGAPKGGKTLFVAWLACEIAASGKCVMFVEEEGAKETLRERLQPFLTAGARLHVAHRKGFRLDDERSLSRLIEEIRAAGAHVLILDPLNQLHAHVRQIGDVPAEAVQAIQRIIRETGCAVILAHHTRKGMSWDTRSNEEAQSADLAGSFAWAASADNIIQIKSVPISERRHGEVRFYVENPDTRNGEPLPRRLAVVRVDARGEPDAMTFMEPESPDSRILAELLPFIPDTPEAAIAVDAIREASGRGKATVQSAVKFGERTGLLVRRLNGRGVYRVKNSGLGAASPMRSDAPRTSDSSLKGSPESGAKGEA